MKDSRKYFFLMLASVLFLTGCPADPDPPVIILQKPQHTIVDLVSSPGLESNLLGDNPNRSVKVYLPPGYYEDSLKHYPAVYLLHAYYCNHETWYNGMANLEFAYKNMNMEETMNKLIKNGLIHPMIVVTPNNFNSYQGSWYTNSPVTGNWEDFIVQDVVQYIDEHYRTIPEHESRGIAGHSMGGYGAMKLAMKHPEVFSSVYTHSTSYLVFEDMLDLRREAMLDATQIMQWDKGLDIELKIAISTLPAFSPNPNTQPFLGDFPLSEDGNLIDSTWEKWLEHDPYTMIPLYKENLQQLRAIQFDCGTMENSLTLTSKFSMELSNNGIAHIFETYDGDHNSHTAEILELKIFPFFSEYLEHADD